MSKILYIAESAEAPVSFEEKSTVATLVAVALSFGWYATLVVGEILESPARDVAFAGPLVIAVVVLVVLLVAAHIVLAIARPSEAGVTDERDDLVALRGERVGGFVLGTATLAGVVLAVVDAGTFWIAQVLIAGMVLSEVTEGVAKLVLYHRGA